MATRVLTASRFPHRGFFAFVTLANTWSESYAMQCPPKMQP